MKRDGRWTVWQVALMLYPFAMPAVAINLFMLGLVSQAIGLPALSPQAALVAAVPIGIPATFAAARWVRCLMNEAG